MSECDAMAAAGLGRVLLRWAVTYPLPRRYGFGGN